MSSRESSSGFKYETEIGSTRVDSPNEGVGCQSSAP